MELDITDLLDVVCGDLRGTYIISRQRCVSHLFKHMPAEVLLSMHVKNEPILRIERGSESNGIPDGVSWTRALSLVSPSRPTFFSRVLHNGIELTPPEFERMGGRHAAKKWKQSIKVR